MSVLRLIDEASQLGLSFDINKDNKLIIYPGDKCIPGDLLKRLKSAKREIHSLLLAQQCKRHPIELQKHRENIVALSHAQRRLWLLEQSSEEQHIIRAAFKIKGTLNKQKLKRAFEKVVQSHRILQVSISERVGGVFQKVRDKVSIQNFFNEIKQEDAESALRFINEICQQPLNLSSELIKLYVVEVTTQSFYILLKVHHLIMDGLSLAELLKCLSDNYSAISDKVVNEAYDYLDFAAWEQTEAAMKIYSPHVTYWVDKLDSFESLNLPKLAKNRAQHPTTGSISKTIPDSLHQQLKQHAKLNSVTINTIYLSALYVVLGYYTSKDDLIIGIPFANRFIRQMSKSMGLFVNTLPVRVNIERQMTNDLLQQVQTILLSAQDHAFAPFDVVFERMSQSEKQQNPFEVIFNYIENQSDSLSLPNICIEPITTAAHPVRTPLTIAVKYRDDQFQLFIDYDSSYFDHVKINNFCMHYFNALRALSGRNVAISSLCLLSNDEQKTLLTDWNNTHKVYKSHTIPGQLLQSFERYAHHKAVVGEFESLTYKQLGQKSKRIAAFLQQLVARPRYIVVYMKRSVDRVGVLCAILLSGAAYVPIEVGTPKARMIEIIQDVEPDAVICDEDADFSITKEISVPCVRVSDAQEYRETSYQDCTFDMSHTAYIIYTSGSTGRPKGVTINQAAIINRLEWMQEAFQLNSTDRVMQKTPYSFDVSVWEFFWPLLFGSTMVVLEEDGHKDPDYLLSRIIKHRVTTIHFVPSMLSAFLKIVDIKKASTLKQIICSGEVLQQRDVNTIYNNTEIKVSNLYGPTEASIDVTFYPCPNRSDTDTVPIGKPIANTKVYVLDNKMRLLPVGVPGELHLSGIGLADGYLNRAELTSEKFVPNPFVHSSPYTKLYKTGDLVKWGDDGNLYYLNRLDHQVKLRGLRIELGEIEAVMATYPGVSNSLVVVKTLRKIKHLVGFYTGQRIDEADLASQLHKRLPNYMVPSYFVFLERFPINKNGKVDRKALDQHTILTGASTQQIFKPPSSDVEKALAQAWSTVLDVEKINISDNFFHLGGDSISLMQVMALLRHKGFCLPIKSFFQEPTLKSLAKYVQKVSDTRDERSSKRATGEQVITPIQAWYFENIRNINYWNQLFRLKIEETIDTALLKMAIDYVVNYHDVFSLKFYLKDDKSWGSCYLNQNNYLFDSYNLLFFSEAQQQQRILQISQQHHSALDIQQGPLAAFIHFKLSHQNERLLIIINHLIVDGVSWRILIEDISQAYQTLSKTGTIRLQFKKTASYQTWGDSQLIEPIPPTIKQFWHQLAKQSYDQLPVSQEDRLNSYATDTRYRMTLPSYLTQKLIKYTSKKYDVHINAILLTPLSLALKNIFKLQNPLVDLESHGRVSSSSTLDFTRTMGWFTSIYPVPLSIEEYSKRHDQITHIDNRLNSIPNKGNDYLKLKYLHANVAEQYPKSDISFNYLGQFNHSIFQNTMFKMAQEYFGDPVSPDNTRKYKINIVAVIVEGELRIDWNYSYQLFLENDIKNLANEYLECLKKIIMGECA